MLVNELVTIHVKSGGGGHLATIRRLPCNSVLLRWLLDASRRWLACRLLLMMVMMALMGWEKLLDNCAATACATTGTSIIIIVVSRSVSYTAIYL